MPSQQVEIAEAIAGIKRALKREREAPSDEPIVAASNRGNKLKQGARYVHKGSLTYVSGPEAYKEKIEHAGYTRYILDRNPRRYNEYGDQLEDSETDEEADADAADQNAYSGIRLEELLCPLKHPSELPVHPSLSHGYLSGALPDMVLSTQEKLRQERANLWRAKYLNRQLMGDASWIPAGSVESPGDWDLFEPRAQGPQNPGGRKRKRDDSDQRNGNGNPDAVSDMPLERNGCGESDARVEEDDSALQRDGVGVKGPPGLKERDAAPLAGITDAQQDGGGAEPARTIAPSEPAVNQNAVDGPGPNGQSGVDESTPEQAPQTNVDGADGRSDAKVEAVASAASDDGTPPPPPPPPPPRPITRALTANNHSSNAPTPPLSPASSGTTSTSSSQLQIDPLYLVPRSCNSTTISDGLLNEEVLETRRLLILYVQKQEESVRGYEAILSKLLTAQRLRTEVLEMCKAEEHVGELSDGEDWIDAERWGLQPEELRKGRDEDDDVIEENTIGGRKGKRRARN